MNNPRYYVSLGIHGRAYTGALTHQPSVSPEDLGGRGGGQAPEQRRRRTVLASTDGSWGVHLPSFHAKEQNL